MAVAAAAFFAVASLVNAPPTSTPSKYVTVTTGQPHRICLRLGEQVVDDTCRTVYGEATVSVRIITATP